MDVSPPPKRALVRPEFHESRRSRHLRVYQYQPTDLWGDVLPFFKHVDEALIDLLHSLVGEMQAKVSISLQVELKKTHPVTGEVEKTTPTFRSVTTTLLTPLDVPATLPEAYKCVEEKVISRLKTLVESHPH